MSAAETHALRGGPFSGQALLHSPDELHVGMRFLPPRYVKSEGGESESALRRTFPAISRTSRSRRATFSAILCLRLHLGTYLVAHLPLCMLLAVVCCSLRRLALTFTFGSCLQGRSLGCTTSLFRFTCRFALLALFSGFRRRVHTPAVVLPVHTQRSAPQRGVVIIRAKVSKHRYQSAWLTSAFQLLCNGEGVLIGAYGQCCGQPKVSVFDSIDGCLFQPHAIAGTATCFTIAVFQPSSTYASVPDAGIVVALYYGNTFVICPCEQRLQSTPVFLSRVNIGIRIHDGQLMTLFQQEPNWLERAGPTTGVK